MKITYLLLWIGDKGRDIFDTLSLSEEQKTSLNAVCGAIKLHIQPKCNPVFSRYKFNNEIQGENTVEQFLTKLKLLAQGCNYADPDEMIRDRIVFGIKSQKVRERLITEGDKLTLDKATQICQSIEYAQEQLRTMNQTTSLRCRTPTSMRSGQGCHHNSHAGIQLLQLRPGTDRRVTSHRHGNPMGARDAETVAKHTTNISAQPEDNSAIIVKSGTTSLKCAFPNLKMSMMFKPWIIVIRMCMIIVNWMCIRMYMWIVLSPGLSMDSICRDRGRPYKSFD